MSPSTDDWKEQLRAEISERVMRDGNEVTMTEAIDIMISHHEDIISALKYDDALAQNQRITDTLECRKIKENLAEGFKAST